MQTNIKVLSLLGNYQDQLDLISENKLLKPEELWTLFSSLPEDLSHVDLSGVCALKVAQALVSHPNLAPEQVLFFLTSSKTCLKTRALTHINFPQKVLDQISQEAIESKNLNQLEKLCSNPNFNPLFLDQIIELPILSAKFKNILKLLCRKAFKPEHFDVLEMIELSNRQKYWLLQNPQTPASFLETFGEQFFHEPLLYQHKNCPVKIKNKGLEYLKNNLPLLYKNIAPTIKEEVD